MKPGELIKCRNCGASVPRQDDHGGIDVFDKGGAFVTRLAVPGGIRDFVVASGHIHVLTVGGVVSKYALSLPEP